MIDEYQPRFDVGYHRSVISSGVGFWHATITVDSGRSLTVVGQDNPGDAVRDMERFVEQAQAALTSLRHAVAADPPESCRPVHAEPEARWLGFGGATYQCNLCGAEWFRLLQPGEPI